MGLFIMPVTSAIDLIIYGLDKRVIDVNSWLAGFHSSRRLDHVNVFISQLSYNFEKTLVCLSKSGPLHFLGSSLAEEALKGDSVMIVAYCA